MDENKIEYSTVDEYIALFTPEIQDKLHELRKVIRETVPNAEEKISWRMPTYALHGNLVHFAAAKKHIGFYPGGSEMEPLKERVDEYRTSKGTLQFSNDKPLPLELIREMVLYRVEENLRWQREKEEKAKSKKRSKAE